MLFKSVLNLYESVTSDSGAYCCCMLELRKWLENTALHVANVGADLEKILLLSTGVIYS